jgi:hypothetical protein
MRANNARQENESHWGRRPGSTGSFGRLILLIFRDVGPRGLFTWRCHFLCNKKKKTYMRRAVLLCAPASSFHVDVDPAPLRQRGIAITFVPTPPDGSRVLSISSGYFVEKSRSPIPEISRGPRRGTARIYLRGCAATFDRTALFPICVCTVLVQATSREKSQHRRNAILRLR